MLYKPETNANSGVEDVTSSLEISGDALRTDIERTADFGAIDCEEGRGRTALPGTLPNGQARSYLIERMTVAGLEVRIDAVGNISGRWSPPSADDDAQPVAAGSHLDSVPEGGIFDGPLGVYAALESVRAIKHADLTVTRPIEVVCFTGEEGTRFADGVLGSSVAAGTMSVNEALSLSDGDQTLEQALTHIGFKGHGRLDASNWTAWFELHVEQGTRLDRAELPVGIVSSITGTTRCHVTFEGNSDHSGTTPMTDRRDALTAASEFILTLESAAQDIASGESESAVATVGSLSVDPGATNVVPGAVELSVDIRDVDATVIQRLVDTVEQTCDRIERERNVDTAIERGYDIPPRPMTDSLSRRLRAAAEQHGIDPISLHSGAGHDTMQVADVTDVGMLFARSRGGYSHSPLERTEWEDCTIATRVLATAIAETAGAKPRG